ncbi:MAG TPA: nickel pincer cofactor biosynthesis protein LarB [Candidatus Xenobia bacterium]
MDRERLKELLQGLRNGQSTVDDALVALESLPFESMEFAHLDTHRAIRSGFPEVVLCQGKRTDHVVSIVKKLARHSPVLATRAEPEVYAAVVEQTPEAQYHEVARAITVGTLPTPRIDSTVMVVSAGTADVPVAEEAALTARWMGSPVDTLFDVGVAGVHRLLHHRKQLMAARILVVVAGMEGALPSVVAGLTGKPVVAVPTSVGYGAHLGGIAPLLTMLNGCAPGVVVVNIDNGFGAGYMAGLLNLLN